jgi:hypothetical protein
MGWSADVTTIAPFAASLGIVSFGVSGHKEILVFVSFLADAYENAALTLRNNGLYSLNSLSAYA